MTKTDSEMLEKLKCNARIGADMSPGDPVAAWAVQRIEKLERRIRELDPPELERAG